MTDIEYLTVRRFLYLIHERGMDMNQATLYKRLSDGTIPHMRVGKIIYIMKDVLDQMYREQQKRQE